MKITFLTDPNQSLDNGTNLIAVGGGVAGGIFILILIFFVMRCFRRAPLKQVETSKNSGDCCNDDIETKQLQPISALNMVSFKLRSSETNVLIMI